MQSSGQVAYFDLVYSMKNKSVKNVLIMYRAHGDKYVVFSVTPQLFFEIKSAQFFVKMICEISELFQKVLFFNAYLKKKISGPESSCS